MKPRISTCHRCPRVFTQPNTMGRKRRYCSGECKKLAKFENENAAFAKRKESLVSAGVDPAIAEVACTRKWMTEKLLKGEP